jgi:adenylate cyclase
MFNIGNERGDFLMQKRWTDGTISTKTIDRSKKDKDPKVTWKYRDSGGRVIKEEIVKEDYDPRKRPWYIGAKDKQGLFWSDVYIFATGQIPGITAAAPVHGADGSLMGIFGLDIPLIEISNFLEDLRKEIQDKKFGKTAIAFIVNTHGDLVAYPDITQPMIKEPDGKFRSRKVTELEVNPPIVQDSYKHFSETKDTKFTFVTKGERYIASYKKFPDTFEKDWTIGLVVPEDDYIGAIKETNDLMLSITVVTMFIFIALAFILNSLQKTLTGLIVTKSKNQKG